MANKLSDGVVGTKLINYFEEYENKTPTWAECLKYLTNKDQVQYRITFEDGSVSDWLVTFERTMTEDVIVSAEMFNEVL